MTTSNNLRSIDDFPLDEQLRLLEQIRDILVDALAAHVLQGVDIPQLKTQLAVDDFTSEAIQQAEAVLQ